MTTEKRQAIGMSVYIALIAVVCSLVGVGYADIKSAIDDTRKGQDEIKKSIHQIQIQISEMMGNRFTSMDGVEVWRELAKLRSGNESHAIVHQNLPPRKTQKEINKNKLDIANIKAILGNERR